MPEQGEPSYTSPSSTGSYVPVAPTGPQNTGATPPSGLGTSGDGDSSGGGKAYDPYKAAQAAADKKEREAKRKASEKYIKQAETLNAQVRALRKALNTSFTQALNIKLGNTLRDYRDADKLTMGLYRDEVKDLKGSNEDNQKAENAQTYANLANRGRERSNALSEAMAQGAGESDVLRAQQMSLRNWSQNQAEVNRGFYDTNRSINGALGELNRGTKLERINHFEDANNARELLWNGYYEQESQTSTALGNVLGQQAELYGLANEMVSSKKVRKLQNRAAKRSGNAFDQASDFMGMAYKEPEIPDRLMNWQGRGDFEATQNMSEYRNAQTDLAPKRPEGATLRAWSQ